jgi:hypothetical protein
MPNVPHIALRIATVAIAALLATSALAQERIRGLESLKEPETTGRAPPAETTGMAAPSEPRTAAPGVPQAPLGHRQPRAADFPASTGLADPADERITQLNREAARGLTICRGC